MANDDKTRIKQSTSDDADKTRIAKPTGADDPSKTRVAPPKQTVADDKTRIKSPTDPQHRVPAADDATRIAPPPDRPAAAETHHAAPDDATRIAPPREPTSNTNSNTSSNTATTVPDPLSAKQVNGGPATSDLRILKERFVLEKVLGSGGMGVVYKAKDLLKVEANDRDPYVAIKVLNDEFKAHPESFIALQRESRKSQRIAHPNIVNVFDFDRDGDTVFMTMEYMEGKPLDVLIRQYKSTSLPMDDAWKIIDGMCAALMHAHHEKIIHSDFKPGNVFVTTRMTAKVFDFGIARAVAKVEHADDGNPEDRTMFDAGNLGALTPAYASLEMLQGKEPDIRDDIYALGCVAYEMLAGNHPFNKLPADQAAQKKLKPKRINGLSKYQWQAIEQALAFKREDRIPSVAEFLRKIKYKYKPPYLLGFVVILLVSVSAFAYWQYFKTPVKPDESKIRNELEYKIRLDLYKQNIDRLLEEKLFTGAWEDSIWSEFSGAKELIVGKDNWLSQTRQKIYSLYIKEIKNGMNKRQYSFAQRLVKNAKRYTEDQKELQTLGGSLAELIQQQKNRQTRIAETRPKPQPVAPKPQASEAKTKAELFEAAYENVREQVRCLGGIEMRNLDVAVKKLKSLDPARYNKLENGVVNAVASCIQKIGETHSLKAAEAKRYALRIFGSKPQLIAVTIKEKDNCDASIAGLGSRGMRTICKDKIKNLGHGPSLVVIPASRSIPLFAISKYEISIQDFNKYCQATKACRANTGVDTELPVSNISFNQAKAYARWLSQQTGKKYRIPTRQEWTYAATAKRVSLDPNRNCKLSTRGIVKGDEMVKVTTGRQNSWGLVNYIGNAQEWVYDKGRKLVAVGGSYADLMNDCNINTNHNHTGAADRYTGFRLVREIK